MEAEPSTAEAVSPFPNRSLFETWVEVLLRPGRFFESIRDERRLGPPLRFGFAMVGFIWVVWTALEAAGVVPLGKHSLGELALFMAARVGQLPLEAGFIGGFLLLRLGRLLGGTGGSYKQAVGICCYSLAALSLGGIPLGFSFPTLGFSAGMLMTAYGFYIAATGVIVVLRSRRIPTLVSFGLLALGMDVFMFHVLHHAAT